MNKFFSMYLKYIIQYKVHVDAVGKIHPQVKPRLCSKKKFEGSLNLWTCKIQDA